MVLLDRLRGLESVRGVSARVQRISHRLAGRALAARVTRVQKRILGACLLLFALVLGTWAHDLAQAEALGGWLREHPPSSQAWKHSLESRGYRTLTEPKAIQRASRSLPSLVDEEGSIWTGADANWIAVFQKKDDVLASTLYCLECQKPPAGWQPLGRGWEAFDPTLALADAAMKRLKPVLKARKTVASDPMELHY